MLKKYSVLSTNQGFILMMTMIMLLILTIIGITAVATSKTDVSMSANFKLALQTFYTADSITKLVLTEPTTFNMTRYAGSLSTITITDPVLSGSSNVTFLTESLPPPGTSARFFDTDYFVISTTGNGPLNARQSQIVNWAQIVPKI